jgi:hypothetical protein
MQPTLLERIREPFYHFAKKLTGNPDVMFYIEPDDGGSPKPKEVYFVLCPLLEDDLGATQGIYVQEDGTQKVGGLRQKHIRISCFGKGSYELLNRIVALLSSNTAKIIKDEEKIGIDTQKVFLHIKTDLEPIYIETAHVNVVATIYRFETDNENNDYIETINDPQITIT